MKTKNYLLIGLFFLFITGILFFTISLEKGGLSFMTENEKAFASMSGGGGVDINIPGPNSEGYCRCKFDGCYAGNMISFRANCGMGKEGRCNSSSNCPPS